MRSPPPFVWALKAQPVFGTYLHSRAIRTPCCQKGVRRDCWNATWITHAHTHTHGRTDEIWSDQIGQCQRGTGEANGGKFKEGKNWKRVRLGWGGIKMWEGRDVDGVRRFNGRDWYNDMRKGWNSPICNRQELRCLVNTHKSCWSVCSCHIVLSFFYTPCIINNNNK